MIECNGCDAREREEGKEKRKKEKKIFFRFCNALTEGRETVVKTE
jgi:hypothetical protein